MKIFWFKQTSGKKIAAILLENDMIKAWRILSNTVSFSDISNAMLNWSFIGSTSIDAETGLIACFNVANDNLLLLYNPPLH
jgi:hypothetical protein